MYFITSRYSSKSRQVLEAIGNACGLVFPESQMLPPALIVGGCVQFEREMRANGARHYSNLLFLAKLVLIS